jgi:hypothetical protein
MKRFIIIFLLMFVASAGQYQLPDTYVNGSLNAKNLSALNATTATTGWFSSDLRVGGGSYLNATSVDTLVATGVAYMTQISASGGIWGDDLNATNDTVLNRLYGYGTAALNYTTVTDIRASDDGYITDALGVGGTAGLNYTTVTDIRASDDGYITDDLGVGGTAALNATTATTIVASGATYLNGTTIGASDTLAVTTADRLTVNSVIVPVYETLVVPISASSVDEYVFVADDLWYLVKAEEIHVAAGTEVAPIAANLTIRICDDAEAVTGGLNATVSPIPLNSAANTFNTATLNSSNIAIANGDMIAFDYAGTLTGLRGSITLTMRRM